MGAITDFITAFITDYRFLGDFHNLLSALRPALNPRRISEESESKNHELNTSYLPTSTDIFLDIAACTFLRTGCQGTGILQFKRGNPLVTGEAARGGGGG